MGGALTRMQTECIRRAVRTDKEIARELGISPHTVSLHIREAIRKLGASGRRDAIKRLAEHPLYADVDIEGVTLIVSPRAASDVSTTSAPTPRPVLFGRRLPPPPSTLGRLGWIVGTFLVLAVVLLIGIALANVMVELISRHAPEGAI